MARYGAWLVLLFAAVLALCYGTQKVSAGSSFDLDVSTWLPKFGSSSGSISDDLVEPNFFDDDEGLLGSYNARRELAAQAIFVSYGALTADKVVCTTQGRSYYSNNCFSTEPVQPYNRGCQQYARCTRTG